MKKTILGMAIMAMALVAPGALAQSTKAVKTEAKVKTEKVCKAQLDCENQCARACEFDGLNLTDTQKEQLKAAKIEYKKNKKALYAGAKETTKEQRDSVRSEVSKQNKELKKAHLEKIKTILTADQYVVFLENNYLNAPSDSKGFRQGKVARSPKDGKRPGKGQKGPRADRGERVNAPSTK